MDELQKIQQSKGDHLRPIFAKVCVALLKNVIDRLEIIRLSEDRIQQERLTEQEKLQDEISSVVEVLINLCNELCYNGTFKILIDYLIKEISIENDRNNLKNEYKKNRQLLRCLKKDIPSKRNLFIGNKLNMNQSLIETKARLENQRVYFSMALNYATKWETARHEQHVLTLEEKQSQFELQIQTMKIRYDQEHFCYNNILSFVQESKNDCLNEIQNWMDKYDNDTDAKDMEIYNLKVDLEKAKDMHANLVKTYEQQCEEIESWIYYKLRVKAAIKIQAWWRLVMIDKQLGPYRPKKKKKKKGKGKDKKGKNSPRTKKKKK